MAMYAMILAWFLFSRGIRLSAKPLVIAVLLVIAILMSTTGASSVREFYFRPGSDSEHMLQGRAAWDIFRISPVFGVGYGRFIGPAARWAQTNHVAVLHMHHHAHNDYLDVLAGGGLVGFMPALIAVGQLLRAGRYTLTKGTPPRLHFLLTALGIQIVGCSVTSAVMYGQFLFPHWILPNGALIAALFGAVWASRDEFGMATKSPQSETLVSVQGIGL